MKRTTKALYAGVAGLALLTTTGGTFALWTDTVALPAASVQTGDLRLALAADVARLDDPWTWTHTPAGGSDTTGFPDTVGAGDKLVGVTYVDATIEGTTLTASLTSDFSWMPATAGWLRDAKVNVSVDGAMRTESAEPKAAITITAEFPSEDPPTGAAPTGQGLVTITLRQVVGSDAFGTGEEQS